jgi:protoporphyrinogen oxidase
METAQSRARVARTRQDVYSLGEEILEGVYVLLDEVINKIIPWPTWVMVFNATFNNISAISWRSVLLVDESTDLSQVTCCIEYNSPERDSNSRREW